MCSWLDLEARFRRVDEALGEAYLGGHLVLRLRDRTRRWGLVGLDDEDWDLLDALKEDDPWVRTMPKKGAARKALDDFEELARIAGRMLSERSSREVPEEPATERDFAERWYVEVLHCETLRKLDKYDPNARSDDVPRGTVGDPAKASMRLCVRLGMSGAGSSDVPALADDWPSPDAIEEAVLRLLDGTGRRKPVQWIADSNEGAPPENAPFSKNACNAALQRLAEKGYVDRTAKGSAATPRGKAWVKQHPALEPK